MTQANGIQLSDLISKAYRNALKEGNIDSIKVL